MYLIVLKRKESAVTIVLGNHVYAVDCGCGSSVWLPIPPSSDDWYLDCIGHLELLAAQFQPTFLLHDAVTKFVDNRASNSYSLLRLTILHRFGECTVKQLACCNCPV